MSLPTEQLINELQSFGVRLADPKAGVESRRGGAGPSDHKALTIDGVTVMAPVHTAPAFDSPYIVERPNASGASRILRDGEAVAEVRFPERPRFYDLKTEDGVPYSHIATLHGRDVLATTVLADLHPLSEPRQDLPILRHRPVSCGGPDRRAQNARSTCRSRARGGRTRWRKAHGHDHRHASGPRSRRGHLMRKRGGRESCRRSPDPGAMRAARRRLLVRTPRTRGR